MKHILTTILMAIIATISTYAQYSKIENISIESKALNQTREIMVYTPNGYDNEYTLYNVIYVFDAQNRELFDYVTSVANMSKEAGQGLIVVGIKATTIFKEVNGKKTLVYARNSDLFPADTKRLGGRKGNLTNFLAYVKNEVIPYVEANYRILPGKTAIGHSLSASFLVYALTQYPDMFDNYVAVSPNLEYDDEFLLNKLRTLDTQNLSTKKYLYMSHADEANWGWGPSNKAAYALLNDTLQSDTFQVKIEEYPNEGHMSGYIPAVHSAMKTYLKEIRPSWKDIRSEETYEVTIQVKVLNENDEVYIFGNQESLANWQKDKIKMQKTGPLEREITLKVQNHVEVQFSNDGESIAWISIGEMGRSTHPMMIKPKEGAVYSFEISENKPF